MSNRSKQLGRNSLAATRVKQVLDAVGNEHLALYQGKGYWYFIYDDLAKTGRYDSHSVYVMRLSDCSVDWWATEGREFCEKVEKQEQLLPHLKRTIKSEKSRG